MDKISVEEKAKAYDKALEKAKKYYKDCKQRGNLWFVEDMEDMFPELKESEDKKMIQYFKDLAPFDKAEELYEKHGFSHKDAIAWLEKQVEHTDIPTDAILDSNKDGLIADTIKTKGEQKLNIKKENALVEYSEFKEYLAAIFNAYNGIVIDVQSAVDANADTLIHLACKYQKPVKVPKFKVGDWVVCNNGSHPIFQVIERSWPNAKYRDIKGTEIFLNVETLDKQYHLWTIQDAKGGDVLVDVCDSLDNPIIFILKDCKRTKHELATLSDYHSFCYLKASKKQEFCIDGWHNEHNLMPATKEQRVLLFQKMREAGYEWDAEKKELKKIEQKPSPDVDIPFGAKDSDLQEATYFIPKGFHAEIDGDKVVIKRGEKKSAEWSEEDEVMLSLICEYIPFSLGGRMWLKELKNRVQPQFTWKPSEGEMEALKFYLDSYIDKEGVFGSKVVKLYNELKKLMEG